MKRKGDQKKNFIDTPYESNINTVFEEHSSPENKILVLLSMMKSEVSLTFPQTVEQIDFVEEVSNLNDSVTSKNQGDKTAFFRKNLS